ncbi:hypothetical protein Q9233_016964 [Columba guinea]|nr:hypothetical protein Q9233_016964 [Columba guinea]
MHAIPVQRKSQASLWIKHLASPPSPDTTKSGFNQPSSPLATAASAQIGEGRISTEDKQHPLRLMRVVTTELTWQRSQQRL